MNKIFFSRLKTGAVMFAVAGAMAFSGAVGVAGTAKADSSDIATCDYEEHGKANTNNTLFTHDNSISVSYSDFRYKYNSTNVYIYPTVGPMLYFRVQGAYSSSGKDVANMSNAHGVPLGVEASFTNTVKKNTASYARLKKRHSKTVPVSSKGWWSPDSTKNYSVYN